LLRSCPRFVAIAFIATISLGRASADDSEPSEASPAQPTPAEVQRAQSAYEKAMEHFDAGEFQAAYDGFERSNEIVASPNSRFMMARTLAHLGENEAAYRLLEEVIRDADALGGRYVDTALSARAKRDEIRARVGLVYLDVSALPKRSTVKVEGESIPRARFSEPVVVLPGRITVLAQTPEGEAIEVSVYVKTGGEERVRLAPAQHTTEEDTRPYLQRDRGHVSYLVEATVEGVYTSIEPPALPNHGGGAGARVVVQVLPSGLIPNLNDSVGIGGGGAFIATSVPRHYWFPVFAQYNLWLAPKWSVLFEPGVAFMTEGGGVNLNIAAGGRYMLVDDWLAVTARVGVPLVSLGVSAFF
jgi:hypothetical protein